LKRLDRELRQDRRQGNRQQKSCRQNKSGRVAALPNKAKNDRVKRNAGTPGEASETYAQTVINE
jgi:hypothetical protein